MKILQKILIIISFNLLLIFPVALGQATEDTTVYLITCGPGTETYSIYGHSALRIVMADKNLDIIYNWGVFDFSTSNFAWKFAKGRLDYMLNAETFKRFIQGYLFEKRYVLSQKINLDADETKILVELINENLKPENIKYRYDFFYDDCSTRIRDLLEKSIGKTLLYPPAEKNTNPTFREMVAKYQKPFPWLQFGIDLIMGSSADKNSNFRDRMFLPIDMKNGLSEAVINRSGKMIPLLQNPDIILDFDTPDTKPNFFISPVFVFTLLMIIVIIFSSFLKRRIIDNWIDIIIYSFFSVLAILMIFFNLFTDHQQMKWNLNIIWLNPILFFCLAAILLKKSARLWFRIVFYISVSFLIGHFLLPQSFNTAILPLVLIILIRSSVRSNFEWNPFPIGQDD